MAEEYIICPKTELDAIADVIRSKTGNTDTFKVEEIPDILNSIGGGGADTSDATATSADILSGKTAYGAEGKITGTIPSVDGKTINPTETEQVAIAAGSYAANDIKVAAIQTETKDIISNGTYTPTSGKYFKSVNVVVPEKTFTTQDKSVTPTESQQIIFPDSGYDGLGSVTVNAIASDYVGSNVPREDAKTITPTKSSQIAVSGGTYINGDISVGAIPDEYITTTDANATSEEIFLNKTAYVNGEKVTGSFTIDEEITSQENVISAQDEMIANIISALEGKAASGGGVTVPELTTITWETNYADHIRIKYLTINANNELVMECTSYSASGSINVVPNTFIYVESEEVENGLWGETYYPNIVRANTEEPFVSTGGTDRSMCVFDISFLGNHIVFELS